MLTFGLLLAAACSPSGSALLADVRTAAPPRSPEMRTTGNRLDVTYRLAEPARVSARIEAPDGRTWPVHEDARRPLAGDYRLALDGTVPGPGPNERQVLPDGDYRVVIEAAGASTRQQTEVPLRIRDADTSRPEIRDLTVFPTLITPNFDADADVTAITYRLAKSARATAFADRVLPDGRRQRAWTGEERRLEAGEQRLRWDGTLSGRPLPDGEYELGIRAEDAAGNVAEARTPLTLQAGGVPEAKVVQARIAPREIIRGSPVCLDVTVRNTGSTVLRTKGPAPDYVYSSLDSYSSIDGGVYVEQAGYWRIGLDWAGSNSTIGAKYPYRWGFGRDLQPGEEATINGCVRVNHEGTKMVFFGGLIRENVAIVDNGVAMVEVRVSP